MKLKIYSIRDAKAEVFNRPFFLHTHGEAERAFAQNAAEPKSMINQYPEDYDLYCIGEFDDQTGKIEPLTAPHHMISAFQLVSKTKQKKHSEEGHGMI